MNDADRAAGARRPILGRAPRTGADLRHGDRRRALRRPAPRHRRGRPRAVGDPEPRRARRARHDRSRGARRHAPHDDGRARGDRDPGARRGRASDRPALRREPLRRARACSSATSPRSSGPTRPSTSTATSSGSAPSRRTWRRARRSRARGSRRASCRRGSVVERAVAQVERIVASACRGLAPARRGRRGRRRGARADRRRRGTTSVAPAFAGYLDVLREYLPHAAESNAVTDLPGGDAIYAAEIRSWTTLPLDPAGGARPRQRAVGGDPGGAVRGRRAARATTTRRRRSRIGKASGKDTPTSAEALVELVEDQVQRSWDIAPQWFGRLPKANCRVTRDRGLPGGRHGARVLHAAHRGRRAARHVLHQHARPAGQGAPPDRRPSRTTRRTRATTSRSPSRWSSTTARRSGASAGSWPARRSPRAGGSTASGSPTRWASTSTTGSGSGCWRRRRIAPPG